MGVVCRELCREWLCCVFVDLRHDRSGGGTQGWEGGVKSSRVLVLGVSENGMRRRDAVDSVLGQSLTQA